MPGMGELLILVLIVFGGIFAIWKFGFVSGKARVLEQKQRGPETAPLDATKGSVDERLRALEKLRAGGLVNEQEYAQKRAEILRSV
jgi:hypothetical protein